MAHGPFEIEIVGLNDLLAKFKGVEEGMLDFRQLGAWKAVASEFRKVEAEQFASEGSRGESGAWKPLTPKYAAIKSRKWGNKPILQASGKGYQSLTQEGAEGSVYEESAQELTLGTTLKHMKPHQTGTSKMPARPPIDLTRDQKQRLMKPVQDKLKQLIANAKLRDLRGF